MILKSVLSVEQVLSEFVMKICQFAISTALSPSPGMQLNQGTGTSPAKVIDSRSKLYKQLPELQNLKTSGILTKEELITEKE